MEQKNKDDVKKLFPSVIQSPVAVFMPKNEKEEILIVDYDIRRAYTLANNADFE